MAYAGLLLAVLLDNAVRLLAPESLALRALPDLPFLTALYIGFRARDTGQLGLAVILGIFADCFSSRPIGHFGFLYGCAAYFALGMRRYVPPDAFKSHVVAALGCGILTELLALLVAAVTVDGPLGAGFLHSLLGAVASALAAPFVFGLWDRSRFFRRALGGRSYEFA